MAAKLGRSTVITSEQPFDGTAEFAEVNDPGGSGGIRVNGLMAEAVAEFLGKAGDEIVAAGEWRKGGKNDAGLRDQEHRQAPGRTGTIFHRKRGMEMAEDEGAVFRQRCAIEAIAVNGSE